MFLACPAEMLPTLQLKTGKLPVLMGSDQVRSVMFLSGGGILVLNQDRTGSFSKQNISSVGQDGNCNRQAIETHDRMVSRWAE